MASTNLTDADITAYEELCEYLRTVLRQLLEAAEYDQAEKYLNFCEYKAEDAATSMEQTTFYGDQFSEINLSAGGPRACTTRSEYHLIWCVVDEMVDEALAALTQSMNEGFRGFTEDKKARLQRVHENIRMIIVEFCSVFDNPLRT